MQDTQDEALPGTVVIERYALTSDGQGGAYEAWTAAGTVMGRIRPMQNAGMEVIGGAQLESEVKWWATLPTTATVYAQDRLVYEGRTYEVISVDNDKSWPTALRCEVESSNEERRT